MVLFKASTAGALVLACAGLGFSVAVEAQQILSAVESRATGPGVEPRESPSSTQAGQLVSTTFGGADSRALTDFGVNKIYSRGTAQNRQYATSNWVDTYIVSGTAGSMVDVSFTFSIDGNINDFASNEGNANVNFNVYALRGGNWSLGGLNPSALSTSPYSAVRQRGDLYSSLLMTSTAPDAQNLFYQFSPDSFGLVEPGRGPGGVFRYANSNGAPGAALGAIVYDEANMQYIQLTQQRLSNGSINENQFFITEAGVTRIPNGGTPIFTAYPSAQIAAQSTAWNINNRSYPILDSGQLCQSAFGVCAAGAYPGTDITLSFSMLAGSSFTLLSSLHSQDLYDAGTIDFFSTAKVTGVSISPGGSLTSSSGALVELPGGGFGYRAALAAAEVPEPSSWAMLIAGFGLVGASMRRRRHLGALPAR